MISVKNLTKKYGDKAVFDNFSIEFEDKKITAVLGESGVGKTTLLNVVSGLTDFDGEVKREGELSFVFQTDRLAKNLTVWQNLKLVLKDIPDEKIESALSSVGLLSAKDLYPKELSAGMARRVAIIRAFLFPSDVLLMDEPFINLDVSLKISLMNTVKSMQSSSPKTVVFVTHDVKEATFLSDRIVVIDGGKIIRDQKTVNEKTEREIFDLFIKRAAERDKLSVYNENKN